MGCGLPQTTISTPDTQAVTCDGCLRALQRRNEAPTFTHEELMAMLHALPVEAARVQDVLRTAIMKLDTYWNTCKKLDL